MFRSEHHLLARIARIVASAEGFAIAAPASRKIYSATSLTQLQHQVHDATTQSTCSLLHWHAARSLASDASPASSSPVKASSQGLRISESAAERLRQLQSGSDAPPVYLRVTVEGGGCSGFQYEFSIEEEGPKEGDQVFSADGATVLCDDVSMEFLKGAVVDFESDLMRSGFVVS